MKRSYVVTSAVLLLLVAAAVNLAFSATYASAQTPGTSCLKLNTALATGSKGTAVTGLQDFLRTQGLFNAASTGYYGPLTAAAVKSFQSSMHLPPVGVVGPLTRFAIQVSSCSPAAPSSTTPSSAPSTTAPATTTTSSTSTSTSSTSTTTPSVSPFVPSASSTDLLVPTTTTATTSGAAASSTINNTGNSTGTSTAATSTAQSLPYNSQTFTDWKAVWGSASTTATGALRLEGSLQNNGAEAIFPPSLNWSNYRYQANVSVANGNISLLARYVDSSNFLACGFSTNWVELDQVYNGVTTVLISKSVDNILPGDNGLTKTTSVAMDVNGDQVGCAGFGPTDNITYTLPPGSPMQGAIGIESWYGTPLADQLDLLSVKVDPL